MSRCRLNQLKKMFTNFVFTINNWTEESKEHLNKFGEENARYMVYGEELGEEKQTPHLQGYCELKKRTRFKRLKMDFVHGAHLEKRRGTAQEAADYCKKDGQVTEIGAISKPGKRNDLDDLKKAIQDGVQVKELFDNHFKTMMRYNRGALMYKNLCETTNEFKEVKVMVYWGIAGSGKTRQAYEDDKDLYKLSFPSGGAGTLWFDGYQGQSTLLMDEFYGQVKYSTMLELLDGYPMSLQVKGGFVQKRWSTIIITSNKHPREWYPNVGYTDAMQRRLYSITEFQGRQDQIRRPIELKK